MDCLNVPLGLVGNGLGFISVRWESARCVGVSEPDTSFPLSLLDLAVCSQPGEEGNGIKIPQELQMQRQTEGHWCDRDGEVGLSRTKASSSAVGTSSALQRLLVG